MRRVLCALALLALVATACGGGDTQAAESPSPSPSPTPSPIPSPEPEPVLAPLTGLPVTDESVLDRPVVALKIDNARPARPQQGLDLADVVIEELVEGGGTRFIALYNSTDPGSAGPVRSGRDVDAAILPAFHPVLGISGAAPPTYAVLRGAGLTVYEEGQADGAFFRERSRPSPHNLFATIDRLWASAGDLPAAVAPWPIRERPPVGGEETTVARVTFSPSARVAWHWDGDEGVWLRDQDGAPHLTSDDDRVSTSNVVVARVPVRRGGGVDVAGSATHDIDVLGEGEAYVFRDGRYYEARWRKTGVDAQFEWLTPSGRPLPLAPGTTWVELVPTHAPVVVEGPPDEPVVDETPGALDA